MTGCRRKLAIGENVMTPEVFLVIWVVSVIVVCKLLFDGHDRPLGDP